MPIIKSARKRVKIAQKATIRNVKTKRRLKDSLKNLSKKTSAEALREAQSAIDKAAKKGVIHKNKAARLKKQASLLAKSANVKITKATPKPKTQAKPKAAATPKTSKPAKKAPATSKKKPVAKK